MISILKSMEHLAGLDKREITEDLPRSYRECYLLAIQSIGHYVIDVNPAMTTEFRRHLHQIEESSAAALSPDQLYSVQTSFRGELRAYRDKSAVLLKQLHKQVDDATSAMIAFAEAVAASGENHELEMAAQIQKLETSACSNEITEMRGGIGAAVRGIKSGLEQMARSNQVLVAQLRDEIRALHLQSEQERTALFTDPASGAWNRRKMDLHLDNLLRQSQPLCLLLVGVRNLRRIQTQFPAAVWSKALEAMVGRFSSIAGAGSMIGRWSEDQFVAVLDVAPRYAVPLSGEATRKLSGSYSIQEDGIAKTISLQVVTGLLDHAAEADSAGFREKLEQLAAVISGA